MATENIYGQMEVYIKGIFKMIKKMGMVNFIGLVK